MTLQPLDARDRDWTPPTAVRLYTGQEAARAVGLSWERFRKVREGWTRDRDFPAELNEPGEAVRYLAAAVDRWVLNRSRRVHLVEGGETGPGPGRPPEPPSATDRAAASAGRARLRQLKGET